MSRIDDIKTELDTDPLVRGYAGMDAVQAANSLNNTGSPDGRTVIKDRISGADAFAATIDTEFDALTPADRTEWLQICAISELEPHNAKPAASTVIRLFGGGSGTVTALQSLREEVISRGQEIGVGLVVPGDVENARAI
jgi:hypothetical protein